MEEKFTYTVCEKSTRKEWFWSYVEVITLVVKDDGSTWNQLEFFTRVVDLFQYMVVAFNIESL